VRRAVDRALRALSSDVEAEIAWPEWDAVRSAINGVVGDRLAGERQPARHLHAPGPRRQGAATRPRRPRGALPEATGKILLLVHGLCMSDRQWMRRGHDHGAALARDLGYTPVYVHYSRGRHVSENGRELAELLETLVDCWLFSPSELAIVAHSLGGLVARSVVLLGTPHHETKRLQPVATAL
jgi:pimeloyl-ACP methyl ester carboxylesterase